MEQKNTLDKVTKIFWIFLMGSIIGYIVEMIVGLVQNGHFVSRQGLLYGPFIPIYGIGILIYYLFVPKIKQPWKVFLMSMIIGGMIEYLCSFLQEKLFGTISWDYSKLWFNFNGRTSLLHCLYWGVAGVLFLKWVYPFIQKVGTYLQNKSFKYATTVFMVFMVMNIMMSCMAGDRQKERRLAIPASSKMDMFLDEYYPDHTLDKIYANKIDKVSKNH